MVCNPCKGILPWAVCKNVHELFLNANLHLVSDVNV